jgi:methyltransferase (TIGR00027 family)
MFKNLKRVVYQVSDLSAARSWYTRFLQSDPVFDTPMGVIYMIGENTLSLVPGPDPLTADNGRTQTYWDVDDVDDVVRRMIELGASLHTEARDVLTIRTARVIDPFGNIIGLSGKIPGTADRTIENQPSRTAMAVCFCRALAAKEDRVEIRTQDRFAELFLPEESRNQLSSAESRAAVFSKFLVRPLYGYFLGRTAFADAVFDKAVRDRIPQIVILGAGYDTRTCRFRDQLEGTKIFELDAPATQNHKREILRRQSVWMPQQHIFVPINFKTDDLGDVLLAAGFNNKAASLFILEGVLYYLPPQAVDATFQFIRNNSGDESLLCFDYMMEKLESTNAGEPFLFWIDRAGLSSFLLDRGFQVIDHADSGELTKRYLMLQDGTAAENPISRLACVLAGKSGLRQTMA